VDVDLSASLLWDVDPVALRIGGIELRYYGICYFLVFAVGYVVWHWQMRRGGHALLPTTRIVLWSAAGIFIGGRLGHCLLYEPEHYLAHPWQILDLSRGGISSHGGVAALFATLFLYARRYGYSFLEVLDRFSMPAALAGVWVRIGNFFNSEIVGREWWGPWAVRFPRFARELQAQWESRHGALGFEAQPLPRHPVQLYEAAGCLAIFGVLLAVDRALGERRPRGLLTGLLLTLYFGFRFGAEYAKEFERFRELVPDPVLRAIRVVPTEELTLGQWLGIPFFGIGAAILVGSLRSRRPAAVRSRFDVEEGPA
jgi:prolipoprotein diacylglyceryl transferase